MAQNNLLARFEKVLEKHELKYERYDDKIMVLWSDEESGRRFMNVFWKIGDRMVVDMITDIDPNIPEDVALRAVNIANLNAIGTFIAVAKCANRRVLIARALSPRILCEEDLEDVLRIAEAEFPSLENVFKLMEKMLEDSLGECSVPHGAFIPA